jgi:hypothetical protein
MGFTSYISVPSCLGNAFGNIRQAQWDGMLSCGIG